MDNYIGRCFGNYQLISLIGHGGSSDVYEARHIVLGTRAAVKVLRTQLTDDKKQRFYAEAHALAQLNHEHILPICDFGIADNRPYVIMGFVSGESLHDLLAKGGKAPLSVITSYVKQIADALHYAHSHKVIHRDLKPSNILLAEDGKMMLADFGIAVIADEVHRTTRLNSDAQLLKAPECREPWALTSKAHYTLAYMAPEQLEGRASAASDQYSLAVVVYEWLTGKLPSSLEPPQERWVDWAQVRQKEDPPRASSLDSANSPEIEQVICKALAKRPEDRYVDIVTFAAALQVAVGRVQEQDRSYPVMWYKQRLEEYERGFRAEVCSDQKTTLQEHSPLELLVRCLTKPYVEKALAHLSWVERSCLLLHIDAGFASYEIAEILDMEESGVQEHLDHGRLQLLETYSRLLRKEQGLATDQQIQMSVNDPILRAERLVRSLSRT